MNCLRFIFILINISLIQLLNTLSKIVEIPKNLQNIKKRYVSSKINNNVMPIIAYNNIFYLENENTKVYYINNDYTYTLKPLLNLEAILYTNTIINFQTLFMARECMLYITEEKGKNTFNYQFLYEIDLKKNFGYCYYTLRIYYDQDTKYAAVYNYERNNKIIILDLEKLKKGENKEDYIILEVKNSYSISRTMIYSNLKEDKSVLIITDGSGIKFYNLKGYLSSFWSNKEGKLIDSKEGGNNGLIDFIDGDKLLYAFYNNFRVFELDSLKEIYQKDYLLDEGEYIKCLLGLKDGNVLVGTNEGYIYLLSYSNNELKFIDYKKICNEPVYSLSFTNNCQEGTLSCYKFAANCKRILIFEIGIGDKSSNNYINKSNKNDNDNINIFIIIIAIIIISIIIYSSCNSKNNK